MSAIKVLTFAFRVVYETTWYVLRFVLRRVYRGRAMIPANASVGLRACDGSGPEFFVSLGAIFTCRTMSPCRAAS